jgi:HK97 family phage prohead protease
MKLNPDFERLVVPVELKLAGAPDKGMLEGYASVFGLEHESGDYVDPGAFRKTIQERVSKGMVPYLDSHQWDVAHTLGSVSDAHEDSKGLHFTAQLSSAPSVQDFRQKVAEGHIKRNSIGFVALREKWDRGAESKLSRHVQEVKLFEISAVPLADDPGAVILGVKAAVPFGDLPLAPRDRAWDAGAAEGRVRAWAGGDTINFARYRRAFLWYDREKADETTAYKLPIADVVNGELTAIPRGIFAAAAVMQGSRGGVDIPESDRDAVRATLSRYYSKMASEFKDDTIVAPWEKKSLDLLILDARSSGAYDFDRLAAAARELWSVATPDDRKRLADLLSAGPAQPPTETVASGIDALAQLKRRATLQRADLLRRRVT